jgi:CubicO group peptidase (beta-lactamase class C family)
MSFAQDVASKVVFMDRFSFIPGMLEQAIAEGVFPSATVGIGLKGETLFTHAAGKLSLPDGTPADLFTRYDLASMTKIIAPTMLTLMALEKGLLALDDTLSRFFDTPNDKADISIYHLMTHTSGITPHFLLEKVCKEPSEVCRTILRQPLDGPPGQMPRYSCMGYILLGFILEKVYGKPLNTLARELVLAPLCMEHTGYCPIGENIAATETDTATGIPLKGIVHDENARFMKGVSANAGLFSDLGDVMRYAKMLASGGAPILNPATLRLAISDRTPEHAVHRGLGFHVSGGPGSFIGDLFPAVSFGHTGFTGTSIAVDPETGLYAVLLTNAVHIKRANPDMQRFRRLFHNRIYATALK